MNYNKTECAIHYNMATRITAAAVLFSCSLATLAQETRTITGNVRDNKNELLIGATVKAKGSQTATITGMDGSFNLSVPSETTELIVSYIGFLPQTVRLTKGKTEYSIRLEPDNTTLNDLVVIGYGKAKKGNLTGAVASVKSDLFDDYATDNIANALQGQLAGVEVSSNSGSPGDELSIIIRGNASIHAEDTPLYVVDGVPVDDLAGLNSSDIASIEVLKDASSSAIYGSRGANGVVLITTKDGGKNSKMTVTAAMSFGIQQINKKLDVLSGPEWIAFRTKLNNIRYVQKYGSKGAKVTDDYTTRMAMVGQFDENYINDPRWSENNYGGLAMLDWQDAYFRPAPVQNYSLAVAQGSDKAKFRASIGYYDQQGVAIGTGYRRLSMRTNFETKFAKIFTMGAIITPVVSWNYGGNVNGRNGTSQTMLSMCPVAEGDAGYYTSSEPYNGYTWASSTISPVAKMEQITNNSEKLELQMSAYLRTEPLKGLNVEVLGSYRFRSQYNHYFCPSSVVSGWSTSEEGQNTSGSRNIRRYHSYLLQATVNYHRDFGRQSIDALLGTSAEVGTSTTTRLAASDFADNSQMGFSLNQEEVTSASASFGTPGRMLSFFGRLQYEYDNRYVVTGSLRKDGSAKFGRNSRWGVFPAIGVAYRLSNEPFWPKNKIVNSLKLRLSWGRNGNNSLVSNAAVGLMSEAGYSLNGSIVSGYAPTTLDNVDLGWERTQSWNFGMDFGFLKNRITMSLDIYRKLTDDLLYKVKVPASMGLESNTAWSNVGSILNKGVEVEIATRNLTGAFSWNTSFNIAYNKNEVLSLGDNNTAIYGGWNNSNTHVFMVGQPIRSYIMYDAVGVYQSEEDLRRYPTMSNQKVGDVRYRDVNGDGKIDENDKTLVGKARPDFTWGVTNKLYYKNFDFTLTFTGQWGGYLYSILGRVIDNTGDAGRGNLMRKWKDSWFSEDEPGDGVTPYFLSTTTKDLWDTRWLYKSDFVKLKNVTLGYNFRLKKNSLVRRLRLYFTIQNLYTWDKYAAGYSPEASTYGSKKTGYDYGSYPMARSYTFGLNVDF